MRNQRKNKSQKRSDDPQSTHTESTGVGSRIACSGDAQLPKVDPGKIYTFVRTFNAASVVADPLVEKPGSVYIDLGSLPNSTEFTSLFDSYRILGAEVNFIPVNVTGPGSSLGTFASAIDYDDANIAPLADLEQYSSYMEVPSNVGVVRRFIPRTALAAYSGVFTSFARAPAGQWIDAASATVQHYGCKFSISAIPGSTAGDPVYRIRIKVIFQCRNSR
jgi:hypothetical protein